MSERVEGAGGAGVEFPETDQIEPPTPKYELTLVIHGNSHREIENELLSMTRGGYLLDSEYHKRDEFHVTGGRGTRILRHTNPDMTPERYDADLGSWWTARKEARHPAQPTAAPSAAGGADGGAGRG